MGVTGLDRAITITPAYTMTKAALYSYTRSLAKELAPSKVKVNMISPGVMENSIDLENHTLPMGRPAYLAEVARVACWLLREENSYITGQNIEIAGGFGL